MNKFCRIFFLIFLLSSVIFFLNARGNDDVPFNGFPERIVHVGSSAFLVENALYLFPEATERVIAMADGNQGNGFFAGDIDPGIGGKTILPRTANTEAVLALKPDTVVMKNFLKSRMGEALERVGVPTVYLDLETPEAWMNDLVIIGNLFGNPKRAAELQQLFNTRITTVVEPLADLPEYRKPKTLMLYWSVKEGATAVNLPPLTWIQTRMVEMAGGDPVWKDAHLGERWTQSGIEQIAAWDPDVIVVAAYHVNASDAVEALLDDPIWSSLRAVGNGDLYAFPGDYHSWEQPDVRWLLGLQWLASVLHPERFPGLDMEAEARSFYRDMFFMNDTDFNKLIKPRLTGLD